MPVTPDREPDTGHEPGSWVVTAREAAERAGVNERTVRRAIARGDLPATRRRGTFAIDVDALDAWRARRDGAPASDRPGLGARHGDGIPEPVTALIGREREMATAIDMLRREDIRLLTLTGAGGIGKTRLGLEVASRVRADFADGVLVVPLAEVADPGLVATAIADRLGIPNPASADGQGMLVSALREARALLVLDNFEHVLAAAPLVARLLAACPRLKVLVTSRSLLRVGGEHALPVPPLALADVAVDASVEDVAASPAVRLFANRARALDPSFAVIPANAPAIAAICQRLGGLPLAIELAASQVTILSPDALLARIEAHLPLPAGGPRDVPDRQRTMTNAIAWSYALLSEDERRRFRRLGVFVGGFALDAVVAVDAAAGAADPLVTLAALVDASLVQRAGDDPARYVMLEPIRAFALDRLADTGELDATCDALAGWCLALVERSPMAASVPGAERHLAHLGAEYPNIRQTLEWLHRQGDGDRLVRLAVALGGYWYERSHYRDGRVWTERALALSHPGDTPIRGRAMAQLGFFLSLLGEPGRGRDLAVEGIALLRDAGAAVRSLASIWLGAIEMQSGAYAQAASAFAEALADRERAG
jgi:excisionase family DNA binding protein